MCDREQEGGVILGVTKKKNKQAKNVIILYCSLLLAAVYLIRRTIIDIVVLKFNKTKEVAN